jgi:hypothetical protein
MEIEMESKQLAQQMAQFTGTEHYYQHPLFRMKYTDGVQFFAENAGGGAYWFLDIVGTELMETHLTEPFISIKLIAHSMKASIVATDGNDNNLWIREIEFTDCPDGDWRFYLIDGILLYVREY